MADNKPTGDLVPESDIPIVYGDPFSNVGPVGGTIDLKTGGIAPSMGIRNAMQTKKLFDAVPDGMVPVVRSDIDQEGSFPKNPGTGMISKRALKPSDHFRDEKTGASGVVIEADKRFAASDHAKYSKSPAEHFTYDANDPIGRQTAPFTVDSNGENPIPTFSGSATHVNPLNDPEINGINNQTYSGYIESQLKEHGITGIPISPLLPFTRMDPLIAQKATLASYNRFHIPVADNEFRKGFRHIFITRPECYICCVEGGLSEQAAYDEDFSSAYTKEPYLCELLSPSYISKINFTSDREGSEIQANWNFLLSNRITSMSAGNLDLNVIENAAKSIPGYTVTTPSFMGGVANGTLDLSFRDTKNLEVSETLRLWMLYMHKRHYGIFAPPYNGYHRKNGFFGNGKHESLSGAQFWMFHPYDRAIEYPCTIFDIITDETDSKILRMITYLGAYPASVSAPLTSENNAAITEAKVSATFRYQARIQDRNTCMALFNYNAGLTDQLGRPVSWADNIDEALPFLEKTQDAINHIQFTLGNYVGGASMFVGSPYIVIGRSQRNPLAQQNNNNSVDSTGFIYKPYLKFMPVNAPELLAQANANINSTKKQTTGTLVSIDQDMTDYTTDSAEIARIAAEYVANYPEYVEKVKIRAAQQKHQNQVDELAAIAQDLGYEEITSDSIQQLSEESPDLFNHLVNKLEKEKAKLAEAAVVSGNTYEDEEDDDEGFNWGGLLKGVLIGAAVVGGVALTVASGGTAGAVIGGALVKVGATAGAAASAVGASAATAGAIAAAAPIATVVGGGVVVAAEQTISANTPSIENQAIDDFKKGINRYA